MSSSNKVRLSTYLFSGLVIANVATISWALFLGHIVLSIHTAVSYSNFHELKRNGIVDVDALQVFQDDRNISDLFLFSGDELFNSVNQVCTASNIVSVMMLIDLVVLILLFRRSRNLHPAA